MRGGPQAIDGGEREGNPAIEEEGKGRGAGTEGREVKGKGGGGRRFEAVVKVKR